VSLLISSSLDSEPYSPPADSTAVSPQFVALNSTEEEGPVGDHLGNDISSVVPDLLLKSSTQQVSRAHGISTSPSVNSTSSSRDGHRHVSGKLGTAGSIDSKSKGCPGKNDGNSKTTPEVHKVHHTGVFRKTASGNYTDLEVDHKSRVSGTDSRPHCCCVVM